MPSSASAVGSAADSTSLAKAGGTGGANDANDAVDPYAGGAGEAAGSRPNPAPAWLSPHAWGEVRQLSRLPNFAWFLDAFEGSLRQWEPVNAAAGAL